MNNQLKNLYEEKRLVLEQMEKIKSDVAARSTGKTTTEETKRFLELEKELSGLNDSIEVQRKFDSIELHREAKGAKLLTADGYVMEEKKDGFETSSGRELPVFNRNSKQSVKEFYIKNNDVDPEISKVGFGQLVRAKLFGAKNELEERALAEGTDSSGGYTVPEIVSADFVDRMRPKSRVIQAGANLFTVDQRTNKFSWAKLETGITAEWKAENASQSPADPTFGQVQFDFKTLRALVVMSNELLQDSINIEKMIEQEAIRTFASELDRVALTGGIGSEPTGIASYNDAVTVSMATNGAAPTSYDEIIALIMELQTQNAEVDGITPAIMHPRTLAAYNVLKDSVNDQPLQRPNYISQMPFLHTTAVGIDDSYGSSNVASKLFMGDWSKLYIAQRLAVQIVPLTQRYAEYNQTGFLIVGRYDIRPTHENAFGYIEGLLGASLPS